MNNSGCHIRPCPWPYFNSSCLSFICVGRIQSKYNARELVSRPLSLILCILPVILGMNGGAFGVNIFVCTSLIWNPLTAWSAGLTYIRATKYSPIYGICIISLDYFGSMHTLWSSLCIMIIIIGLPAREICYKWGYE